MSKWKGDLIKGANAIAFGTKTRVLKEQSLIDGLNKKEMAMIIIETFQEGRKERNKVIEKTKLLEDREIIRRETDSKHGKVIAELNAKHGKRIKEIQDEQRVMNESAREQNDSLTVENKNLITKLGNVECISERRRVSIKKMADATSNSLDIFKGATAMLKDVHAEVYQTEINTLNIEDTIRKREVKNG